MDVNLTKKAFLDAYAKTFGNKTQSCKAVDISRQTLYNWLQNDPEFKAQIENIEPDELLLDFVESKMVQKINDGDTAVLIFVAKTKGKKRGYVERQEIEQTNNLPPIQLIFPNERESGGD